MVGSIVGFRAIVPLLLAIQAVSSMGSLPWHGSQVGPVIGWPLPQAVSEFVNLGILSLPFS